MYKCVYRGDMFEENVYSGCAGGSDAFFLRERQFIAGGDIADSSFADNRRNHNTDHYKANYTADHHNDHYNYDHNHNNDHHNYHASDHDHCHSGANHRREKTRAGRGASGRDKDRHRPRSPAKGRPLAGENSPRQRRYKSESHHRHSGREQRHTRVCYKP